MQFFSYFRLGSKKNSIHYIGRNLRALNCASWCPRRYILLVVWKCLILCQIIVICGKCWFSSFIRRKRLQKVYEDAALSETTCRSYVLRYEASKTVISLLMTVRVKEGQKPSKTLILFIMSCWNRTKPSLGNGIERNWCVSAEHCAKNGQNTSRGTKKWFFSMTNARPHVAKPVKTYLETLKWKFPPVVFPRYCAVRLLFVSVDGTWSGWSAVLLIWRHRKMAWFVDSLKRWTLLP